MDTVIVIQLLKALIYRERIILTLESTTHQLEIRMPKMEVSRLSKPMSKVPVFREPHPQQLDRGMIPKSENLLAFEKHNSSIFCVDKVQDVVHKDS